MLISALLFIKSGGKTVNEICSKKAWAKSMAIFKLNDPDHCPRTGFCAGITRQSTQSPHSPNGGWVGETICHPDIVP
jgi:hypothetical protein